MAAATIPSVPAQRRYHVAPMPTLSLALGDLAVPSADAALPRLGALERLLARGRREAGPGDFRRWALAQAGLEPPARLPLASLIAGRPGAWALATPVNLVAGLDRVHLHPAGLPRIALGELEAVAATFNAELGADGVALEPVTPSLALLSLLRPVEAEAHDPAPLAGREAGDCLPAGPDGGWLRRLMTEAQMLLHAHPVNAAREARGELPINALWLWGTGGGALAVPSRALPTLGSADPFLRSYWAAQAARVEAPPGALGDWLRQAEQGPSIVTLELSALAASPAEALEAAEERWFAPLERALATRRLDAAELYLCGRRVSCTGRDRLRFWRQGRPWREALA
jgi:hypothetical protein